MKLTSAFLRLCSVSLAAALTLSAGCGPGPGHTEAEQVRKLLQATWQREAMPLEVDPVVVAGRYAVADWTQGTMGGRALLERRENGWQVLLCAGDLLRSREGLASAGVAVAEASRLAAALQDAERQVSAVRLAQMASFKGLVRMDAAHATQAPASAADPVGH